MQVIIFDVELPQVRHVLKVAWYRAREPVAA